MLPPFSVIYILFPEQRAKQQGSSRELQMSVEQDRSLFEKKNQWTTANQGRICVQEGDCVYRVFAEFSLISCDA